MAVAGEQVFGFERAPGAGFVLRQLELLVALL